MGVAWSSGLGRRSGGSRVSSVEHGATRPVTAEDDPGAEHKPSGARRVVHIVGAVVVVLVLPALVIGAFVGELGVSAMFTGVLLGAVGAKLGGTHRMLYVAPALGVAGGLGAYTAYDWWWVALLAAAGVIAGAGIRFGWFAALLMVPYAATFVTPVSTVTDAVIYGVILAIASLYGVVLARRFGAPEDRGWRSPCPARRRRGGGHVRTRSRCHRGDRGGAGLDRALLGSRAGAHLGPVHHHGQTRPHPRQGARHRARNRRRRSRSPSSRRLQPSSPRSASSPSSSRSRRPRPTG